MVAVGIEAGSQGTKSFISKLARHGTLILSLPAAWIQLEKFTASDTPRLSMLLAWQAHDELVKGLKEELECRGT